MGEINNTYHRFKRDSEISKLSVYRTVEAQAIRYLINFAHPDRFLQGREASVQNFQASTDFFGRGLNKLQ